MKFGKLLKKAREKKNTIVKLYFFFGSLIILGFFLYINNEMVKNAKREAEIVPDLFAHFVEYSSKENFHSLLTNYILENIIKKIDYPVIVTDEKFKPIYWKNIGFPSDKKYDSLTEIQKIEIDEKLEKMKKKYKGISLVTSYNSDQILGYTFYDESKSIKQLKFIPFVEVVIVIIFIVFGIYIIFLIKKREKDKLWVGLAKETAHQFGTPISSLLGWIELLKIQIEDEFIIEGLDTMEQDVNRLNKVASRFGKVGSNIKLKENKIHFLIEDVIEYFEKRLENQTLDIKFHFISKLEDCFVKIDKDLITWAFENLIKNSIDAMAKDGGDIVISGTKEDKKINILFKDTGKGIPKSMQSEIFKPGITSKKRGWGLGLSLTKRIIEEYHGGKISAIPLKQGEGAMFLIELPEIK